MRGVVENLFNSKILDTLLFEDGAYSKRSDIFWLTQNIKPQNDQILRLSLNFCTRSKS